MRWKILRLSLIASINNRETGLVRTMAACGLCSVGGALNGNTGVSFLQSRRIINPSPVIPTTWSFSGATQQCGTCAQERLPQPFSLFNHALSLIIRLVQKSSGQNNIISKVTWLEILWQ